MDVIAKSCRSAKCPTPAGFWLEMRTGTCHGWQQRIARRLRLGGEERLVLEAGGEFLDVKGSVEAGA